MQKHDFLTKCLLHLKHSVLSLPNRSVTCACIKTSGIIEKSGFILIAHTIVHCLIHKDINWKPIEGSRHSIRLK